MGLITRFVGCVWLRGVGVWDRAPACLLVGVSVLAVAVTPV